MIKIEKSVCFTGHRPKKMFANYNENSAEFFAFKQNLHEKIVNSINEGYKTFYSGMAMGVDIIAFEMLIKLKNTYPDLVLIGVMPSKNQCYYWSNDWISRHANIRKHCDSLMVMGAENNYNSGYFARNRYLVDNSNLVIAVYNGDEKSGTGYTVNYAIKKGKSIEYIHIPMI